MNIEDRIFAKCKIDHKRLIPYGFVRKDDTYIYQTEISEGFDLYVSYTDRISIRLIDTETDEEYLNYRYSNQGDFAYSLKTKIEEKLIEMRDFLTSPLNYISRQANYLDEYMSDVYGQVEFTFKGFPDYGVYRESGGDKWYAIIMKISANKLDKNLAEDREVEIINLKVEKKKLRTLIQKKGIYPAYHMNKENWVSVTLDDSLSDVELILMINDSYDLVQKSQNEKKYYRRY